MTTIIMMLLIIIFPRNRRDIFLLYYVKKKRRANALAMTKLSGSNLRPAFPSHSIYASRKSMAGGLPLILLLLPRKYTAFLACVMKTSRCSNTSYIYISLFFLSSPYRFSLFFCPYLFLSSHGSLSVRSLSHSFSRYADAILLHNIIW